MSAEPHTVAVDFDGVTAELPELPDTDAAEKALADAPCDSLSGLLLNTPDTFDAAAFAENHPKAVRQTLLAPEPVSGARDALQRLRDSGHRVVITTNRPEALAPVTRKWLELNDIPHDALRCVGSDCRKGTLPDVDVVIDDTPHNALAAAQHGEKGVLFAREWTDTEAVRNTADARVARDWQTALNIVRDTAPATASVTVAAE